MSTWLAQHFFNPSFIWPWGVGLLALPVIIHLINRMRFRRVRFAAMEFLLQSQQRNRRRFLLEQLLLLALRVLIVAALLSLLGRLILDPNQLSIFRGAKSHHLIVIDDSGSMRDSWGETSAFDEALEVAKKLVAEGARRPDTQQLTLLLLSDVERPLFVRRDVNDLFLTEFDTKLENLRCSHRRLDLVHGLEAAGELLSEDKATIRHVHVVSDFREGDWQNQKALSSAVRTLDDAEIAVNLVKTAPEQHENLAVTELTGDAQVAAVGVPLRLRAGVKNFSPSVAEDVRLAVVADGNKLPMSIVFNKIESSVEVFREFDVLFDTPGKHKVRVSVEGDALAADNSRFLAIDIARRNDVLIVDGDPLGTAASFVADALAADPDVTGFAPLVESVDYLRKHPLEQFQCIYLLNVSEIQPDGLQELRDYVDSGGGLAWFLGDAVNPAFYNDKLYEAANGLFPVPLASSRRDLLPDATNPGADLQFASHPVFRIFEGQDNPFIDSVSVGSWLPAAEYWPRDDNERKDGVSTICLLRNGEPLMFEHQYGTGRIVTSLTSAGPAWNSWPRNPSYVVFQLELEKHIAKAGNIVDRRIVGETIELDLDPAVYTESVQIAAPDVAAERVTRLQAAPRPKEDQAADETNEDGPASDAEGGLRLIASYRETDRPGVYRVTLIDHNQVATEQWVAYNAPVEESDLAVASNLEIQKQLGADVRVQIQEAGSVEWIQGDDAGQDVRALLLAVLFGLLLSEQLLAYRLSYHPRVAGAAG